MIGKKAPLIGRPAESSRDYRNIFDNEAPAHPSIGCGTPYQNRRMFRWLAARLAEPYDWPEGKQDNENRRIPAGYTYLAQFVIHDTIQSDLPDFSDGPTAPRNNRSARLVLDAIYGKGPGSDPLFYASGADPLPYFGPGPEEKVDLAAALDSPKGAGFLRIGSSHEHMASRDLPRRACPFAGARPASDVLIADARNDDNAIVSQITVLFHLLHNLVYGNLKQQNDARNDNERHSQTRVFSRARKVVTRIYRTIVFDDLLRLLLHPIVYERYSSDGEAALLDRGDARMPLEFSHAVARFGHCMIRDSYAINADLRPADQLVRSMVRHNSARRAMDMPLASKWLVDWARLFDKGDDTTPLRSRRIGPAMTRALVDNTLVRDFGLTEDPAWQPDDLGGVAYRDLLRGGEAGLRSTREIVGALPNWICELSPLMRSSAAGKYEINPSAVRKWMLSGQNDQNLRPDIKQYVDCLTADIPLLLFVLVEAAETRRPREIRNGECLGAVGSVILAEVWFREFWRTYPLIEGDPDVAGAYSEALGNTVLNSMPNLIAMISREMHWGAAQPKFW